MVGSTKGRGVQSSMKMGRLMATFDPRRLLMFAVRVLVVAFESQRKPQVQCREVGRTESGREDS
jgi:hypothetical protein